MNPNVSMPPGPRLTSLSHGGGCGCKIAPGVLSEILKNTSKLPMPPELLVGIETADDAAVYQLTDEIALIATTDFFMPIVDDPFEFGRIAAANALSDVYAMGGKPIMALALVGMPINVLSTEVIGRILEGGEAMCRAAGIPIAGGHTIDSVEPIYGLVALGVVHPQRVKRNADARVGDRLILGKPLGVGILSAALKKESLSADGYAQMIATTTQLNTPGPDLAAMNGVHAVDRCDRFRPRRPCAGTRARRESNGGARLGSRADAGRCARARSEGHGHRRFGSQLGRIWRRGATAGWFFCRRQRTADRPANERRPARVVRCRRGRRCVGGVPSTRLRCRQRDRRDRGGFG